MSTPAILLSDSSDGMDSNFLNSLNLEFIALNERSPDFLTAGLSLGEALGGTAGGVERPLLASMDMLLPVGRGGGTGGSCSTPPSVASG